MKKLLLITMVSVMAVGCASNSKPKQEMNYVTRSQIDHCMPVATLTSNAFSIFPPVASHLAQSMIEKKAEEFKVNSIEIKEQTGLFQVNIEAIGYRCSDQAVTMKNKKSKSKR